jgi:4-diphosphocytidyl-2-C-methyl-D-erythritol kinase
MAWVGKTRARAKINLTLHIKRRKTDGYHELESLVAFASVGDEVELIADRPLSLRVTGPESVHMGETEDNHILAAAQTMQRLKPEIRLGAFHLIKRLPVASGIGGGSADAAAALRLLARLNRLSLTDPALLDAAITTGADVPVCLESQPRMMRGIGEQLGIPLHLPRLFAVLVNPRISSPTPDVFNAIGLSRGTVHSDAPHLEPKRGPSTQAVFEVLRASTNHMQPSAIRLIPAINDVEAALANCPKCRLIRMSGSGATLFGLFDTCRDAGQAAKSLARMNPGWWIKATTIG